METSPSQPYEAFLAAQTAFGVAVKDSANPFFKSHYADLQSIWTAVREALHQNGLTVTQPIRITETGHACVVTTVRYKDGTVIETSECPVVCKVQNDPQAMGSAITYARRYSLAAIFCIVTDDDDAEGAMSRNAPPKAPQQQSHTLVDIGDWRLVVDAATDAADLNRIKKDIAGAKMADDLFSAVWGALSSRGKKLGISYDKQTKRFS